MEKPFRGQSSARMRVPGEGDTATSVGFVGGGSGGGGGGGSLGVRMGCGGVVGTVDG